MAIENLPICFDYVPDWTIVEAIRELFQNAKDNQTTNPENVMFWDYNKESKVLTIGNKTSVLERNSLLIGKSSKRNDENTIGQHGEGYKIAFMVLMREGKNVTVYNYGKKEIWTSKVVKSKKYKENVPALDIKKEAIWKKVPDNNLTIVIEGITEEEYEKIKEKNLNLRKGEYRVYASCENGEILEDKSEKGNIYVSGLYVCNVEELLFGYNCVPKIIKLDRDRKLLDTIDVQRCTSSLWIQIAKLAEHAEYVAKMITDKVPDVRYVYENLYGKSEEIRNNIKVIKEETAKQFKEENGEDAVPVVLQEDLERVISEGVQRPVMVDYNTYSMIRDRFTITRKIDTKKVEDFSFRELIEELWKNLEPYKKHGEVKKVYDNCLKKLDETESYMSNKDRMYEKLKQSFIKLSEQMEDTDRKCTQLENKGMQDKEKVDKLEKEIVELKKQLEIERNKVISLSTSNRKERDKKRAENRRRMK